MLGYVDIMPRSVPLHGNSEMSGLLGLSGSLGTTLADGFQQKIKAVWNSLPDKSTSWKTVAMLQKPRAVSETSERGYCVLL